MNWGLEMGRSHRCVPVTGISRVPVGGYCAFEGNACQWGAALDGSGCGGGYYSISSQKNMISNIKSAFYSL